jgi:hypothetical protein
MLKLAGGMLCQHMRCTSVALRHMHGQQEAERSVGRALRFALLCQGMQLPLS